MSINQDNLFVCGLCVTGKNLSFLFKKIVSLPGMQFTNKSNLEIILSKIQG